MNQRLTNFPKITAQEAVKIAVQQVRNHGSRWIEVHSNLPENVQIYPRDQAKGCWSVLMSQKPGGNCQSSYLVCVSQTSGKILYAGTAHDEG